RARVLGHLAANGIDDVAVLTGDIHSSWAMDLAPDPFGAGYDATTGRGALAVEFVTPSVTSPGVAKAEEADARAREALAGHPHMRYVELITHGYVLLDIDRERLQGEFWHMNTIERRDASERLASAWLTERGANHLVAARGASAPSDAREPAPG
ncbi:MAG: alkaline phosphatase D family protein, partial [Pseudomonadales bacterium]|nr:alkaline phosphatase D family protein [Pseudomonadales bacterium]